jgi:hypothetical protein
MSDAESTTRVETAKLIRTYYEAFNGGDTAAMLDHLTDDVIHDVNQGERRQGKDKFKAFNARMTHNYSEQLKDLVVMVSRWGSSVGRIQRSWRLQECRRGAARCKGSDIHSASWNVFRHSGWQNRPGNDVL